MYSTLCLRISIRVDGTTGPDILMIYYIHHSLKYISMHLGVLCGYSYDIHIVHISCILVQYRFKLQSFVTTHCKLQTDNPLHIENMTYPKHSWSTYSEYISNIIFHTRIDKYIGYGERFNIRHIARNSLLTSWTSCQGWFTVIYMINVSGVTSTTPHGVSPQQLLMGCHLTTPHGMDTDCCSDYRIVYYVHVVFRPAYCFPQQSMNTFTWFIWTNIVRGLRGGWQPGHNDTRITIV